MLDIIEPRLLVVGIGVCILLLIYSKAKTGPQLPDLPWVYRDQTKWFSKWRARIQATIHRRDAVHTAYKQYSLASRSCILPSLSNDVILLPHEASNWIASQPDASLCFIDVARSQLQIDHTFLVPQILDDPTHHDTIRMDLTRQLGSLTTELLDELDNAFATMWGTAIDSWTDVCVYETMIKIIARTSNRVFVGNPLCRNPKMLDAAIGFAQTMPPAAAILRKCPSLLRPVLSSVVSFFAHRREKEYTKILMPTILARLSSKPSIEDKKPNDFLQWTIDRALGSGSTFEAEPRTIAARLLVVNFAAIHTSTFSITNAIFDLLASESSNMLALREEAQAGLASTNGVWTKATLQALVKHDSTLRESSRLGSFLSTGLTRLVTAADGLIAPNGTHCPYGSWIGVAANAIHYDPENYPDVESYKPFRFSELKEAFDESNKDKQKTSQDIIKKANLSFVTTSDKFMAFGHGRHACLGRFFAANELKLLLSYMVLNYEFQVLDERPPSRWVGEVLLPPMKATIRVKRRMMTSA